METDKQMIEYKKETLFSRIKKKIMNFFSRRKETTTQVIKEKVVNKQDFFNTYNAVKEGSIDLDTIEPDTLYRIILLLKEEIDMSCKKADEKIQMIETSLANIKMYSKDIELMKKKA